MLTCAACLSSRASCLTCQKQSPVMKDMYLSRDGGGTARGLCTQASHRAKPCGFPSPRPPITLLMGSVAPGSVGAVLSSDATIVGCFPGDLGAWRLLGASPEQCLPQPHPSCTGSRVWFVKGVDPAGSITLDSAQRCLGPAWAGPCVNWHLSLLGAGSSVSWEGQCSQGESGTDRSFAFRLAPWQAAVAGLAQRRHMLVASPLGSSLRSGVPGQTTQHWPGLPPPGRTFRFLSQVVARQPCSQLREAPGVCEALAELGAGLWQPW